MKFTKPKSIANLYFSSEKTELNEVKLLLNKKANC